MTAKEHYETHLANVYSWMLGEFHEKMSEQMDFFLRHKLLPSHNGVALDLGAGNGIQSVALAKLGFKVTSIDFNKQLLHELTLNSKGLPITVRENDILSFFNTLSERAELIVCMGDTLTHLSDYDDVSQLIKSCTDNLVDRGKLVFAFRDLANERKGSDRFFHVRSDEKRSMTCFLEYFPGHVMVYDILTEKEGEGWMQKVSSYPKLRIPVSKFKNTLTAHGLQIIHEEDRRGMTYLIAYAPDPR